MLQSQALELLKLGHNVFLTGAAGSGKTYLLNQYIHYLQQHQVGVAVTASTGLAATHLNGMTIHRWSGIGIRRALSNEDIRTLQKRPLLQQHFRNTKVLIIDEVSMLHAYQLDLIDQVAKAFLRPYQAFGGLQVVLSGDFFQLPPIKERDNHEEVEFAFESSAWKTADFRICHLSEQHRQKDDPLLSVLNDIRQGETSERTRETLRSRYKQTPTEHTTVTKLYALNRNVDAINQRELEKINNEEKTFAMETMGAKANVELLKQGCLALEALRLKKGAEVMFIKNHQESEYVNGTRGTIESFEKETGWPVVRSTDGKRIVAKPEEWRFEEDGKRRAAIIQIPLRLAWAITIHKSQGMTLDAAEVNLSVSFEPGMGYVALSRVRTLEGLQLTGFSENAFVVNPKISEFDRVLQAQSLHSEQELGSISSQENTTRQHSYLESIGGKPLTQSESESIATPQNNGGAYSVKKIRSTHRNAYKPWSEDEDLRLLEAYQNGATVKQLCNTLQRQPGGIRSRLKKLNIANDLNT